MVYKFIFPIGYELTAYEDEFPPTGYVTENDKSLYVKLVYEDGSRELLTHQKLGELIEKSRQCEVSYNLVLRNWFNVVYQTMDELLHKSIHAEGVFEGLRQAEEKRNSHLTGRPRVLFDNDKVKISAWKSQKISKHRIAE